jgi:hypothetical protein
VPLAVVRWVELRAQYDSLLVAWAVCSGWVVSPEARARVPEADLAGPEWGPAAWQVLA